MSIVVFAGPSIDPQAARRTLPHADYRPPIRRGDLDGLGAGDVIGIIDGVFDQSLAISPGEIRAAIERGAAVYGAASMGALRAAEIRAVTGIGRIYEMYASGAIDRDDEVALLFDPQTNRPMTEPMVNIRYAVERLVRSATLPRPDGEAIIAAAEKLHYTARTYPAILRESALAANTDAADIIALLRTFDLKRDDAQFLLETLAAQTHWDPAGFPSGTAVAPGGAAVPEHAAAGASGLRVRDSEEADAPVLVWESGDRAGFAELVRFLAVTGDYERHARQAIARMRLSAAPAPAAPDDEAAQTLLDEVRLMWGWESPEEAHITMRDLGLGLMDVAGSLRAEVATRRLVTGFAKHPTPGFRRALRAQLWADELALKREVLRLGAVAYFAELAGDTVPTETELEDARRCVTRLRRQMQWHHVLEDLAELGLSKEDIDSVVLQLARARHTAAPVAAAMERRGGEAAAPVAGAQQWREAGLALWPSPKARGSNRFSVSEPAAIRTAEQIAAQMGVNRVGLVGELSTLGVHVAQAFADRTGWSASFSSGKAETRDGARAGAIMEEAELHAQDAYRPTRLRRTSYAAGDADLPLVDPATLGLPYDSRYTPTQEMEWAEAVDLISGRPMLLPLACLCGERQPNDIFYSPRLGGKIFSSSGLGSGFTLAEAAVHAAAECVERHAQRLAEIELDNPGGVGQRQFWFVDEDSLPEAPLRIVGRYREAGMSVRILDMTSDIAVPTFYVRVFEDPFHGQASTSSDGFACHPDASVAVTMALLEAAQTKAGFIAGGREDYSLQARSLGRHERPRTSVAASQVFWFAGDRPTRPLSCTEGLVTTDLLTELEWLVQRVADAGYPHLLVTDFTTARIAPAHAVRVVIPQTETTNPMNTGPRARVTCIRDLLPHAQGRP